MAAESGAQEKAEIEKRTQADEVPVTAVEWLDDAYEKARRIRWYYEETSGIQSYEAKLKWKGQMHSVEFDTSGMIQDIEILVEWEELPENVRKNIAAFIDSAFHKHRIEKIQKQWTGAPSDLEDLIDEEEQEALNTSYEIEFYGKNDIHDELWEGLFDAEGRLLKKRIVKLIPNDNLNF